MTTSPFMQRAIELAIENVRSGRGGPFGAVVVKGGRIIAEGTNRVTTSNDPSAHAEIVAIREACRALGAFQLDGCEIYTNCYPCPMCFGAIYWARPDCVYYACTAEDAAAAGFDDTFIYNELRALPAERKIKMEPMMRDDAQAAFRAWLEYPGRVKY